MLSGRAYGQHHSVNSAREETTHLDIQNTLQSDSNSMLNFLAMDRTDPGDGLPALILTVGSSTDNRKLRGYRDGGVLQYLRYRWLQGLCGATPCEVIGGGHNDFSLSHRLTFLPPDTGRGVSRTPVKTGLKCSAFLGTLVPSQLSRLWSHFPQTGRVGHLQSCRGAERILGHRG